MIKVLLLGVGRWGSNHLRMLSSLPVELFVSDIHKERLSAALTIGIPATHLSTNPRFAGQSHYGVWNRLFKSFGKKVASVFDDMLDRSVPFYREIQRMIGEMAVDFAVEGTNIYNLGCSTGTTLLNLGQNTPGKVKFIGIDYSQDMIARCRQKLDTHHFSREYELICADLNQGVNIENASVVVMVLTLQFIRPLRRDTLIGSILRGLNENGCLILVEKVLGEDSAFNRLFINYYYDFKK